MKYVLAVIASVSALAPACLHAQESPVFGKASVKLTTAIQNKAVVGKGTYADLYGYYGNYYAINALYYGNAGFYYKNYSDYSAASTYAGYAANYYSYASYYQKYGY